MRVNREFAGIIKFILEKTGNPAPYYYKVPEDFFVPAAYLPQPEITTGGETFLTYGMDIAWYVVFFHKSSYEAYLLGLAALRGIKAARNLIPLINEDGEQLNDGVRLNDPDLKILDDGAAQLTLNWRSREPYVDAAPELSQIFNWDIFAKSIEKGEIYGGSKK